MGSIPVILGQTGTVVMDCIRAILAVFVTGGQTGVKATGRVLQHIWVIIVRACIAAIMAIFVTRG